MLFKITREPWKMHIEFYIISESRGFVERPESSQFKVTYKDKIQLENADIKTPIMGTGKSCTGIMVLEDQSSSDCIWSQEKLSKCELA